MKIFATKKSRERAGFQNRLFSKLLAEFRARALHGGIRLRGLDLALDVLLDAAFELIRKGFAKTVGKRVRKRGLRLGGGAELAGGRRRGFLGAFFAESFFSLLGAAAASAGAVVSVVISVLFFCSFSAMFYLGK